MGIFPKIFDNGFRAAKRLLAVGNPFFAVTGVQKLFENIMVFITPCPAVEFKLTVFPQLFQFCQIFAAEEA